MTTMSASALIVMAVIMVAAMAAWLSLVFLAARTPRQHGTPAGTSPGTRADAASGGKGAPVPPPRRPRDEEAAESRERELSR
ncbi:MAG TPA: hypothetical protein VMC83_14865 [Streptosporangiaceae bacterium]|nr:hypothetical protein [Streptosporangiaceae bacterium]